MSRDAREYLDAFKFDHHMVVLWPKPKVQSPKAQSPKVRRVTRRGAGPQRRLRGPSLFATLLEQAPRCLLLVDGHLASA